jgi:hypothetical protein
MFPTLSSQRSRIYDLFGYSGDQALAQANKDAYDTALLYQQIGPEKWDQLYKAYLNTGYKSGGTLALNNFNVKDDPVGRYILSQFVSTPTDFRSTQNSDPYKGYINPQYVTKDDGVGLANTIIGGIVGTGATIMTGGALGPLAAGIVGGAMSGISSGGNPTAAGLGTIGGFVGGGGLGDLTASGANALVDAGVNAAVAPIISQAATGAATGSLSAAANGGDIGQGALYGAAAGGIGAGVAPLSNWSTNALINAGISPAVAETLAHAAVQSGANTTMAGITGNNLEQAAISGAIKGGATGIQHGIDYGTLAGQPISIKDAISAGANENDLKIMGFNDHQIQANLNPDLFDKLTPTMGQFVGSAVDAGGQIAAGIKPWEKALIDFGVTNTTPAFNYLLQDQMGTNLDFGRIAPLVYNTFGPQFGENRQQATNQTIMNNALKKATQQKTSTLPNRLNAPVTKNDKLGPIRPSYMSDSGILSALPTPKASTPTMGFNKLQTLFG